MQIHHFERWSVNREAVKGLAWLTMIVDHVGVLFFPAELEWRMIGRIAWPLFVLLLVDGLGRTRDRDKMAFRLLIWACVSQGAWMWGLHHLSGASIMGSLALAAWASSRSWEWPCGLAGLAWLGGFEYGWETVLGVWVCLRWPVVGWVGSAVPWLVRGGVGVWAAPVLAGCAVLRLEPSAWRPPAWLSYGFYPWHLLALGTIERLLA